MMIDSLIEEYYPRVYAFVLTHVKSEAMAKDVTQDVFLQLIKRKSRLSEIDHLESYIFTMTRNAVYRHFRNMKHNQELKVELLNSMASTIFDGESELESRELEQYMYAFVNELPERQKEIFHLSREEGLTHQQIAEKLNISPHTVKNHMVQALKTLRSGLELLKIWIILAGMGMWW